jgi:hypothetical protein
MYPLDNAMIAIREITISSLFMFAPVTFRCCLVISFSKLKLSLLLLFVSL